MRTETGNAAVLITATVAALVWANVDAASYGRVRQTTLSIEICHTGVSHRLRYWVSRGLKALFFFVVGLEARRKFDIGELRERTRLACQSRAVWAGCVDSQDSEHERANPDCVSQPPQRPVLGRLRVQKSDI